MHSSFQRLVKGVTTFLSSGSRWSTFAQFLRDIRAWHPLESAVRPLIPDEITVIQNIICCLYSVRILFSSPESTIPPIYTRDDIAAVLESRSERLRTDEIQSGARWPGDVVPGGTFISRKRRSDQTTRDLYSTLRDKYAENFDSSNSRFADAAPFLPGLVGNKFLKPWRDEYTEMMGRGEEMSENRKFEALRARYMVRSTLDLQNVFLSEGQVEMHSCIQKILKWIATIKTTDFKENIADNLLIGIASTRVQYFSPRPLNPHEVVIVDSLIMGMCSLLITHAPEPERHLILMNVTTFNILRSLAHGYKRRHVGGEPDEKVTPTPETHAQLMLQMRDIEPGILPALEMVGRSAERWNSNGLMTDHHRDFLSVRNNAISSVRMGLSSLPPAAQPVPPLSATIPSRPSVIVENPSATTPTTQDPPRRPFRVWTPSYHQEHSEPTLRHHMPEHSRPGDVFLPRYTYDVSAAIRR